MLGKRDWQIAKLRDGEEKFFKADTNTFEERELLGMRKEIWEWMVLSLEGEHKTLFCAHLVRDKWDIQQLYKTVREFLHTENYREYEERMERFFTARPKEGEDIFSFMSRMDKYEEEITHLLLHATPTQEEQREEGTPFFPTHSQTLIHSDALVYEMMISRVSLLFVVFS